MVRPLRLLSRGLLALALLALPQGGSARGGLFNPESFTLENGLSVVVIPDHRAPIVVQMVWYKVGAADEVPGESGIAHFLEHLMFKGTPSVPPGEFSKIIARNGGRDNAFTSHDYTAYFQTVAADKLALIMELEADRMANLVLSESVVKPERDVVLEERRARVDNEPAAQFGEQLSAAQFLAHPYGRPIIGWEHEVRGLTTEDAIAFYRAHYAPNNAILVIAGDTTAAEVRPLAERFYGPIPARPLAQRLRPQEPPQLAARRLTMRHARVTQPSWRRSYLAPSSVAGESRHALPLRILAEILGGGTTSRLYRALVVEQKIAAVAGSHYSGFNLDLDEFTLFAAPVPGGDVAAIETAVEAEVGRLIESGITQEELDRAKAGLTAASVYARDSLSSGARLFGGALAIGLSIEYVERWVDRVEAVTLEQVNEAAHDVFRIERSVTGILLPETPS